MSSSDELTAGEVCEKAEELKKLINFSDNQDMDSQNFEDELAHSLTNYFSNNYSPPIGGVFLQGALEVISNDRETDLSASRMRYEYNDVYFDIFEGDTLEMTADHYDQAFELFRSQLDEKVMSESGQKSAREIRQEKALRNDDYVEHPDDFKLADHNKFVKEYQQAGLYVLESIIDTLKS